MFFLSKLGIRLLLRFGNDGLSGLFRKCSKEKKEKKRELVKVKAFRLQYK